MSAKGEEIFKSILRKNASADKGLRPFHMQSGQLKKSNGRYRTVLQYAAAFIILLVAGLYAYHWKSTNPDKIVKENSLAPEIIKVVNSGTTAQKLTLEDGSTVILEPGGEVRYNEKFLNRREVYLSGDAFFEVTKDASRPFLVYANEITTKVLGTSFSIKAKQGEKEIVVAVKTGKVSVMANSVSNDVPRLKIYKRLL